MRLLSTVPEKHSFELDGRKIYSAIQLVDELETVNEEALKQCVRENQLANWLEQVFGQKALANEIKDVHNTTEMQNIILKHLAREYADQSGLKEPARQPAFRLPGGKSIKNLVELARELKRMKPETFMLYVNENKNDFAQWVANYAKDNKLSILMRTTINKERMVTIVERRIKLITEPASKPSVIKTKHITPLILARENQKIIRRTGKTTRLHVSEPRNVVETPNKTNLNLGETQKEIYVHEIKKHHHSGSLLFSHLLLGLVTGVALAIFVMALAGG